MTFAFGAMLYYAYCMYCNENDPSRRGDLVDEHNIYISPIAGLLLLRRNQRLLGFYLYVRTVLTALGPKIEAMYKSLVLLAEGRQVANVYLHFDRSLFKGYCPIGCFGILSAFRR